MCFQRVVAALLTVVLISLLVFDSIVGKTQTTRSLRAHHHHHHHHHHRLDPGGSNEHSAESPSSNEYKLASPTVAVNATDQLNETRVPASSFPPQPHSLSATYDSLLRKRRRHLDPPPTSRSLAESCLSQRGAHRNHSVSASAATFPARQEGAVGNQLFAASKFQVLSMCQPYRPQEEMVRRLRGTAPHCAAATDVRAIRLHPLPIEFRAEGNYRERHRHRFTPFEIDAANRCLQNEAALANRIYANLPLQAAGSVAARSVAVLNKVKARFEKLYCVAANETSDATSNGSNNATDDSDDGKRHESNIKSKEKKCPTPIRVITSFGINNEAPRLLTPPMDSRMVLFKTFLDDAVAGVDELHFITDNGFRETVEMAATLRRVYYRQLKEKRDSSSFSRSPPPPPPPDPSVADGESSSGTDPTDANLNQFVARIRVYFSPRFKIASAPNADGHYRPSNHAAVQSGTNKRVFLLAYYVDHLLPRILRRENRRVTSILTVDARDTFFQSNVLAAIERLRLEEAAADDSTAAPAADSGTSSAARAGTDLLSSGDAVFVIAEQISLNESKINRMWLADLIGEQQQVDDVLMYHREKRASTTAPAQESSAELRNESFVFDTIRRFPDSSNSSSSDGLPVLCSGVYGATSLRAMSEMLYLSARLIDLTNSRHGIDQAVVNLVFYFALSFVRFPFNVYVLSPLVGDIARHMIAREHVERFPRDTDGRFLNCNMQTISCMHQLDRHRHLFAAQHVAASAKYFDSGRNHYVRVDDNQAAAAREKDQRLRDRIRSVRGSRK